MLSRKVFRRIQLPTAMIILRGTPGYIPGPDAPNDKDWDAGMYLRKLTLRDDSGGYIDNRRYFKEISSQLDLPSCVANAHADLHEAIGIWTRHKAHGGSLEAIRSNHPHLSRMAGWWWARSMMDPIQTKNPKSGTWNRMACEVAVRFGLPVETLWPYDASKATTRPSISAAHDARSRVLKSFCTVKSTGPVRTMLVRKLLLTTPGLLAGINLPASFFAYTGGVLKKPTSLTKDWHSIVIVGYSASKKAFLCRNSHGAHWGEDGYFWLSEGFVASGTYTRGIFALYG